jgi:hypothetical protein
MLGSGCKRIEHLSRTHSFSLVSELESLSVDMIRWLATCASCVAKLFVKVACDRGTLSLYKHRQVRLVRTL